MNCLGSLRLFLNPGFIRLQGISKPAAEKLKELQLPAKPKKPPSTFIRFYQCRRLELMKENKDLKATDIARICSKEWKVLGAEQRTVFDNEFKKDMEKFIRDSAQYNSQLSDEQKTLIKEVEDEVSKERERKGKRKEARENGKPKRPPGAFALYLTDLSHSQKKSIGDVLSAIKGKWAQLDPQDKARYVERALLLKKEYDMQMTEWEGRMVKEGKLNLLRTTTLNNIKGIKRTKI